ncbi:MAG: hypothetical protein JWQ70_1882 [Aeromicrobium sp.]|nr:hypothetical protein [Aeromicrobium sp.]
MINFRYHLVSIAAIMLALAAGIALGSGPLDRATSSLNGDNGDSTTATDPGLAAFESAYAARTSGPLLKDALKGQSVVVITVPGSNAAEVRGVTTDLKDAGAEVTGQIELSAKLLDPSGRGFAEGIAQQAASDVPGVSAAGDSYGRIGAAIGRAFLGSKSTSVDQTATTISAAFKQGALLSLTTAPKKLATLAVIIAGPQRSGDSDQSSVIAALAGALGGPSKGVVVAGPSSSSTDGGAVKAVRDGSSANSVSTVDVTDSAAGRVVTVLAAAQQASGQSGSWGTSRSTDGALPR